jgi:hypothetical protein
MRYLRREKGIVGTPMADRAKDEKADRTEEEKGEGNQAVPLPFSIQLFSLGKA